MNSAPSVNITNAFWPGIFEKLVKKAASPETYIVVLGALVGVTDGVREIVGVIDGVIEIVGVIEGVIEIVGVIEGVIVGVKLIVGVTVGVGVGVSGV